MTREEVRQRSTNSLIRSLSSISPSGVDSTNCRSSCAEFFASAMRAASSPGSGSIFEVWGRLGCGGRLGAKSPLELTAGHRSSCRVYEYSRILGPVVGRDTHISSISFHLLLRPHAQQWLNILIPRPIRLEVVQELAQVVLHVPVATVPQDLLDGGHKLGVEIARERGAGVIGEDAHEHDRIVLDMVRGAQRGRQVFTDAMGSLLGRPGARFGGFNDEGEVDEFISLLHGQERSARQ